MNKPHLIASLLAIAPSFLLAATPILADSPCIFTGRLMDAEHVAFDTLDARTFAVLVMRIVAAKDSAHVTARHVDVVSK